MEPSHRSNTKSHVVLDVLGPTVEFMVLPSESEDRYCVLKGTIPPGVSVPLHSHPDDESFFYSPAPFRLWYSGRVLSNG
jgi:quercetin dioxygenase-like cupin family protein